VIWQCLDFDSYHRWNRILYMLLIMECWKYSNWAASRQNQHGAFATSMDPDQPAHPQYNMIECNAIQCNTIQYNTMQCKTIQNNIIQYNTMQDNTIQGNATQLHYNIKIFWCQHICQRFVAGENDTIQYNTIQFNAMQCNATQLHYATLH
jgi:hypothetical protein